MLGGLNYAILNTLIFLGEYHESSKKHHFVPKSYLRFFAQEKNQDKYQIYVFDKQLNKEFICNINDIAEKYNYNRIDKKVILFQRQMEIPCTMKKNIEL